MHRALTDKHSADFEALHRCVGLRVSRLTRSQYLRDGRPASDGDGHLELQFEGGRTVVLTTDADGESVAANEGPLELSDPFTTSSGSTCAWEKVELSEPPYARFLGEQLLSVDALIDERLDMNHRSITGWVLHIGDAVLSYVNESDEGYISAALPEAGDVAGTTLEDSSHPESVRLVPRRR